MAQIIKDINKKYRIIGDKNNRQVVRGSKRNYARLQNWLDEYCKKNNVQPNTQAVNLSLAEVHSLLGLTGNYDRYQACRQLGSQIEEKLNGYLVVFYQQDNQKYFDFIPISRDKGKDTEKNK